MELPEPHEGIRGIRRTRDDLLSRDRPAMRRRHVMIEMAARLWESSMDQASGGLFERMRRPGMGDLVVEMSTLRHPGLPDEDSPAMDKGFGILLGTRDEWSVTRAEWEKSVTRAAGEGCTLTEADRARDYSVHYVQYGPGPDDVCRWGNALFIAFPTGLLHHTREMQG